MKKVLKQVYTTEFMEFSIEQATDGTSIAVVVEALAIGDQMLRNWIKTAATGYYAFN